MSEKASRKRDDVQGLRGVAIIAVILFHVNPNLCPRGLLGVDIFFVISGYLMWTILSKEKAMSIGVIAAFYSRRFARIVPLYTVFAIWTFAPLDLREVIDSTKWAALFGKNVQQILESRDYWAQATEFAPLLHTWSLSVEIQFYLIAPLLHAFISSIHCSILRLIFTLTLAAASLGYYGFSNETTRFFSLPCRLWQFLIGFIAAQVARLRNEERETEDLVSTAENGGAKAAMSNDCLILMIFAAAAKTIERFSFKQKLQCVVISYSLITFLLISGQNISNFGRDQRQIAADDGNTAARNFTSEELIAALYWSTNTDMYPFPPTVTDTEAQLWTNYTEPKHTSYSFLVKGTGHLSILLLGNSFAWRAASVIPNAFAGKFKTIRLFSELGCPILTWQPNCTNFRAAFTTVLERMKPDLVWVIAWEPQFFVYSNLELERQVTTTVKILQNHTRHIVIDGQSDYHGFNLDPKQEMIRRLQLGQLDFSDMQLTREKHNELHEYEWSLMRSLESSTVTFNNVADQFCEPDDCPFYNPRNLHQYYGDRSGHLNQEGLDRLRPEYKEIANRITEKLAKS